LQYEEPEHLGVDSCSRLVAGPTVESRPKDSDTKDGPDAAVITLY
jgi:hypothetical protein